MFYEGINTKVFRRSIAFAIALVVTSRSSSFEYTMSVHAVYAGAESNVCGIPMGTNCAPLVIDLFLFCCERDFMLSLLGNDQTDIIEAFYSASGYLDGLLGVGGPCFGQMVGQIYPTGIQLNKANSSDAEALFLELNLSIIFRGPGGVTMHPLRTLLEWYNIAHWTPPD